MLFKLRMWFWVMILTAAAGDCGPRARGLVHLATELYVVDDEEPALDVIEPDCGEGTQLERDVCVLVNAERANRRLGALTMDPALTRAAEAYARRIYAYNQSVGRGLHLDQSSHHVGGNLMSRLVGARVAFTQGGENLHSGSSTAASAVNHWMASPNHYQEITTGAYRKTGVGQYQGIWVQLFTD